MQDELITLQTNLHKTIVFITHDLDEALKIGDKIVILRDGEVAQEGEPQEIVANPADDYVSEFVQDVSRAKVIQAASIMIPATLDAAQYPDSVEPQAYIEEIVPLAARSERPIAVVDAGGRLLGEIRRGDLLAGMAEDIQKEG